MLNHATQQAYILKIDVFLNVKHKSRATIIMEKSLSSFALYMEAVRSSELLVQAVKLTLQTTDPEIIPAGWGRGGGVSTKSSTGLQLVQVNGFLLLHKD